MVRDLVSAACSRELAQREGILLRSVMRKVACGNRREEGKVQRIEIPSAVAPTLLDRRQRYEVLLLSLLSLR